MCRQGPGTEAELVRGSEVKVTTDPAFREACDSSTIWVDYANITKVIEPGKKIYIDDGNMSLIVKRVGTDRQPAVLNSSSSSSSS